MKNKISITIFSLATIIVVILFSLSIMNLTKDRNLNFDTSIFTSQGYESIPTLVSDQEKEYNEYVNINEDKIKEYNIPLYESALEKVKQKDNVQMVEYLNENIQSENIDQEHFIESIIELTDQEILKLNKVLYEDGIDPDKANLRAKDYAEFKQVVLLRFNLEHIKDNINEINSIEYGEEELLINTRSGVEVYESYLFDKLQYNSPSTVNATKKIIISEGMLVIIMWILVILITILLVFNFLIFKHPMQSIKILIIFITIVLIFIGIYYNIERRYFPIQWQINDSLRVSQDMSGMYYLDFRPILELTEFQLRGGELPSESDLENATNEQADTWLNEVNEFDYLDHEGNPTGEKYTRENGDVLNDIKNSIEFEKPSNGSGHPGFGGYFLNQ